MNKISDKIGKPTKHMFIFLSDYTGMSHTICLHFRDSRECILLRISSEKLILFVVVLTRIR